MASKEVTIQIRESQASKPFIEVFEEDQKLWEVYKFAEESLGAGVMLWNVNSQEIYTAGTKGMKKTLVDLGLTGNVMFMGVRKERIPAVAMRPQSGGGGGGYQESAVPLEERKEKVKQFLQEKREINKLVHTEEMKEAEKERRRIGQELMKEKMQKERDEMKKVSESISNRKAAHRAELEAIRAQVARDKEIRKKEREAREGKVVAPTVTKSVVVVVQDGKVKMKIRVAETTLMKTFEGTDLFSSVMDYVKQEVKGDVTLSNTYPRKEYKSEDLEKSLASLGLKGSVSLVGKSGAEPVKAAGATA